jgi:hypothetical protein
MGVAVMRRPLGGGGGGGGGGTSTHVCIAGHTHSSTAGDGSPEPFGWPTIVCIV